MIDLDALKILLHRNVNALGIRRHSKASEMYVDVVFDYPDKKEKWMGSVPIHYRRTGVFAETPDEAAKVINSVYSAMHPDKEDLWLEEQEEFWSETNKEVTRGFFEVLKDSKWKCVSCQLPPNPNWARRTQDIKEFGYTLATDTRRPCKKCGKNTTQLILLRIPRGLQTGYETITLTLRKRIIDVLDHYDAFEDRKTPTYGLLPDHKFPEIRWDEETMGENLEEMGKGEIRSKFQLITNQRNQQKREVCRKCFQTGKRGTPYRINFFYAGGPEWPRGIPKTGKGAEPGCIGCGWYDLVSWRAALNIRLT